MADADDETLRNVVPWEDCLPYERVEALNELRSVLSGRLFATDDVHIKQIESTTCITGQGTTECRRSLQVVGSVSPNRIEAINILEEKLRRTISDFWARIDFEASILDELPPIPLAPLGPVSLATRAKNLWQRARCAVRCGVIRTIGEARGLFPPPPLSSPGDEASDATPKRRAFLPISTYQACATSPCINLSRFAANNPCVIVLWASWDAASITYLEENIFTDQLPQNDSIEDDPWLRFALRYVDFKAFHEQVAQQLPLIHQHVPSHQRHTAAGQAALSRVKGAKEASMVRRSIPAAYRSFIAFSPEQAVDLPRAASSSSDESHDACPPRRKSFAPAGTSKTTQRRRRHSRWQVSNRSAEAGSAIRRHTLAFLDSIHQQGLRRLRLGHIVLVNVDSDVQAAEDALLRLTTRLGSWTSSVIGMHSMWGGSDGLHSEVAGFFNPTPTLPFICSAQPERVHAIDQLWYETPVVTLLLPVDPARPRRPGECGESLCYASPQDRRTAWHELPADQIRDFETAICGVIEQSDCALSFEAQRSVEFPLFGPNKIADSTLETSGHRTSYVELRGTVTESVRDALVPTLRAMRAVARNIDVNVTVIESSAPIALPINERTPMHRVKGWKIDVTCARCDAQIIIDQAEHFHCLHCDPRQSAVCLACVELHDPAHILTWIPKGSPAVIPVLWGRSNVARLPLLAGQLVLNESGNHVGVWCNACCNVINGYRWKCAFCPDADLCNDCFVYWQASARLHRKERRHPSDHIFMRVTGAVVGDVNVMFTPRVAKLDMDVRK